MRDAASIVDQKTGGMATVLKQPTKDNLYQRLFMFEKAQQASDAKQQALIHSQTKDFDKIQNKSDNQYFGVSQDQLDELRQYEGEMKEKYAQTPKGIPIDIQNKMNNMASEAKTTIKLGVAVRKEYSGVIKAYSTGKYNDDMIKDFEDKFIDNHENVIKTNGSEFDKFNKDKYLKPQEFNDKNFSQIFPSSGYRKSDGSFDAEKAKQEINTTLRFGGKTTDNIMLLNPGNKDDAASKAFDILESRFQQDFSIPKAIAVGAGRTKAEKQAKRDDFASSRDKNTGNKTWDFNNYLTKATTSDGKSYIVRKIEAANGVVKAFGTPLEDIMYYNKNTNTYRTPDDYDKMSADDKDGYVETSKLGQTLKEVPIPYVEIEGAVKNSLEKHNFRTQFQD